MNLPESRSDALALDGADPLAGLREEFYLPEGVIYLDGNSLGALPRCVPGRLAEVIERQWGDDLIRSWNAHGWIDLPVRVGDAIAPLVGAGPGQVLVADSTSMNIFKLLAAALPLRPGRPVILSERQNFPTDVYMARGLASLLPGSVEIRLVERAGLRQSLDQHVAVLMLTHVDFRMGEMHDMAALTAAAHEAGALVLWDLAHSAGAVPVELDAWGVDLAVGCGYKYLNGGPGAPAFLYVARRLQEQVHSPLWGWLGHADPFAFDLQFRAAPGIARFLCSSPPILSLAALAAGVELVARAGIQPLRHKSLALTDMFISLAEVECAGHGLTLASPRDGARRGSQVSLRHRYGYPIVQALIRDGVIGDFRPPDLLRFGFAPAYLRFGDVWDAVAALRHVLQEETFKRPEFQERARVT